MILSRFVALSVSLIQKVSLLQCGTVGTRLTKGCRFARNAADGSLGMGGIAIRPPPGGSLTPIMVFEDTEWVDNLSGSGPAVFVYYGQVDLRFRRCYFRCDPMRAFCPPILLLIAAGVPDTMSRTIPAARSMCSGRRR